MATRALLNTIEGIAEKNDALAEQLIDLLREKNLLSACCIGGDAEDGVSIIWTRVRLFCNIAEEKIYISCMSREPYILDELKFSVYEANQLDLVCQEIAQYRSDFPGELV